MPKGTPNNFKILVIGSAQCGKTTLIKRAVYNTFDAHEEATVGVDFYEDKRSQLIINSSSTVNNDTQPLDKFNVWDTSGKKDYRHITTPYYKGSNAVILVTDLNLWGDSKSIAYSSEKNSFSKHITEVRQRLGQNISIYVVGTKQDIAQENNNYQTALDNLTENAKQEGILANYIFSTASKETISENQETTKLKSPRTIFDFVYTHCQKSKTAEAQSLSLSPSINTNDKDADDEASLGSRFCALFAGAVIGAVMGIITHNPVNCFLAAWRAPDWSEWGLANIVRIYVFAPFINPLFGMFHGFISGGALGAEKGVTQLLQIPKDVAAPFKLSTILTGCALSLLIGLAITMVVIPMIPLTLPIILGIAGAAALIIASSYEGIDFLTDNNVLKKKIHHPPSRDLLKIEDVALRNQRDSGLSNNNRYAIKSRATNVSEKARYVGSWRSWFQVPPAAAETVATQSMPLKLQI